MTIIAGRRGAGTPTRQLERTPGAISSSSRGGGGDGGPNTGKAAVAAGCGAACSDALTGTVCSRRGGSTPEPNALTMFMSASVASVFFFRVANELCDHSQPFPWPNFWRRHTRGIAEIGRLRIRFRHDGLFWQRGRDTRNRTPMCWIERDAG